MQKQMTDIDYVELYAEKFKIDGDLFKQHKIFIESQLRASWSLFSNLFKGKDFKVEARRYLEGRGLV